MNLIHLKYFQKTAQVENISKAAMLLHIAQPYLSRVISSIESELGVDLFEKHGRSIRLTPEGHVFQRHVDAILREYSEALAEIRSGSEQTTIQIQTLNVTRVFPELIGRYTASHPGTRFVMSSFDNIYGISKDTDLVIHASEDLCKVYPSRLLFQETCFLGMSVTDPLSKADKITADMLAGRSFIMLLSGNSMGDITGPFLTGLGIHAEVPIRTASQQALATFVEQGLGIAFFPGSTWNVQNTNIVFRTIEEHELKRNIYISNPRKSISPPIKEFADYLIQSLQSAS